MVSSLKGIGASPPPTYTYADDACEDLVYGRACPYPALHTPTGIGACSFFVLVPSVHHNRLTTTMKRPRTVTANSPIRPMNASSKPTAVTSGQMLGAGAAL